MDMNRTSGYIDIHTHILPGVDDGSGSMEETIRMLRIALEERIETIIATPHYAIGADNTSTQQLILIQNQVQEEAYKLSKDMKILMGNELFYSDGIVEALKAGNALTLAESRYVLVEFRTNEVYNTIYKGLGNLIRAGYIPILAHVERYQCLFKKEDLINDLIRMGCYIQMNSDSLSSSMFDSQASFCRRLVKQGLIHFIASDCHDDKHRVPALVSAVKMIKKKIDDEGLIDQIFYDNPISILENTYI